MTIDTVSGAKSSAVIYSLVETAKENGLNPYAYFKYLLTELPKLKEFNTDQEESAAMERLLPWANELPAECHKQDIHYLPFTIKQLYQKEKQLRGYSMTLTIKNT